MGGHQLPDGWKPVGNQRPRYMREQDGVIVRLDGPGQWSVLEPYSKERAATLPSRDRAFEWAAQYTP